MAQFTNTASLSYSGGTVNSNTVTGLVQDNLTASKTSLDNNYAPGDNVTFLVNFVNTGDTALNTLTLTDDLGAYTSGTQTVIPLTYNTGSARYYVNGVLQTAPTVTEGQNLVFTGLSVPAGGNALVVYEATANQFASPESTGSITNTATITGPGLADSVVADTTLATVAEPVLTINKAVSPAVVNANGELTYTFTIQNSGNTEATVADNVVLNDLFDPRLNITSVTYNGAPWAAPANYTYDAGTGQFTSVAGQITVPAAAYVQNANGSWTITPGVSTVTVTGNVI